jgi:hypothetical protein
LIYFNVPIIEMPCRMKTIMPGLLKCYRYFVTPVNTLLSVHDHTGEDKKSGKTLRKLEDILA